MFSWKGLIIPLDPGSLNIQSRKGNSDTSGPVVSTLTSLDRETRNQKGSSAAKRLPTWNAPAGRWAHPKVNKR
jgi:hypothetical protein